MACAAPRYLAMHEAVQHAPAILESFKKDRGNVPSNCAIALGNMFYESALDVMLEYFSCTKNAETFLGILHFLGKIHHADCRDALKSAVIQVQDTLILGTAVTNLLHHHNSEDVPLVIDKYFDLGDRDQPYDTYLRNISVVFCNCGSRHNIYTFTRMWIDQGKPTISWRFRFIHQILTF